MSAAANRKTKGIDVATSPVVEQSASSSIAIAVAQNPVIVLVDDAKREDLYAHIRREVEAFVPDLSSAKGREAIKSFAFKITRTKTAIDDAGKKLNEEARARINVVDAARRDAREKLDAMAKSVRQPLTDWEEAEKARHAWADELIASFRAGSAVSLGDTASAVRERGKKAWEVIVSEETLGDRHAEVQAAKDQCVEALKLALARLTREEEERAELERLRAEAAERERVEAERAAEEQRRTREAEEARIAEERRLADEKAAAERVERAKQEAVEAAQREAERAAQAERDRVQREHDEALAAERRRAEEVEAAEARRLADAQREAAEQAARDRDQKHKTAVMKAAKEAIMTCGADEETAKKVVLLIRSGDVPNVTLRF